MSIADKITQLTTIRGDIRTALAGKGVSASGHDYADFAADIAAIPSGGGGADNQFFPMNLSLSLNGQDVDFDFVRLVNYDKFCIRAIGGPIQTLVDYAGNNFTLSVTGCHEVIPLAAGEAANGDYLLFYPSSASVIPYLTTEIYQRVGSALTNDFASTYDGYLISLDGSYTQGTTIGSIVLVKAIRSQGKFVVFGALVLKNPITLSGTRLYGQFTATIGEEQS